MNTQTISYEELVQENNALRQRLEESEALVSAIRDCRVDAFVVGPEEGERVLILEGCDHPYRRLVDRMQQGAISVAGDGTIAYVNPRFCEMTGRSASEMVGVNLEELVSEALRPIVTNLLAEGRERGGEGEILMWRSDGNSFPAHVTASPLTDANDVLCIIVTDLTLQKQHEEVRAHYVNEKLARLEAERLAAKLQQQNRGEKSAQHVADEAKLPAESRQTATQHGERSRWVEFIRNDILEVVVGLKFHAEAARTRHRVGDELSSVVELSHKVIDACRTLTQELEQDQPAPPQD